MPAKEDWAFVCFKKANRLPLPARASQTLRPGMQTSKGNFWPLYLLVSGSTHMSLEGHLQWSPIISHWKWHIRRALQVPLPGSSEYSCSYSNMMQPLDTDQGRKCCLPMHWADAPHELLGKSNWIWESITLPSARPGLPNSRKLWGKTPFLVQCTSLLSRDGHTKGGILCEWPGHTGTSETSSPQTRDCGWWVLEMSFHPAFIRSIWRSFTMATSLPQKSNRMPINTCIGQG